MPINEQADNVPERGAAVESPAGGRVVDAAQSKLLDYVMANPICPLDARVLGNLCRILENHICGDRASVDDVRAIVAARDEQADDDEREYKVIRGLAIVPVGGVIAKYSRMVNGSSQPRGTSVETLRRQIEGALADSDVTSIFLQVESPGGNIAGLADLADLIFEGRRSKPVTAYADDMAASAAYWLGAQADQFLASQSAEVGSIGVYSIYVDTSRALENKGVRVIPVASGAHKTTGYPGTQISEAQLEPIRTVIDQHYEMFVRAVLRGRAPHGMTEDRLREVADGRMFVAAEAQRVGLVDGVMNLRKAMKSARALAKRVSLQRSGGENDGVMTMDENTKTAAATVPTPETPDPVATAKVEKADVQVQMDNAVAAERARIGAIDEALGEFPEIAAEAKAGGMSLQEAKAKAFDVVQVKLATTGEALGDALDQAANLRTLMAESGISEAVEVGAGAEDDGESAYAQAIREGIEGGKSADRARLDAARKYPKEHDAWVLAQQPKADAD